MKNKKFENLRKSIVPILKKNKLEKAGIFGSYARGEEKKNSDVDIVVKINSESGFSNLIKLKLDLEKKIKKKVDLSEYCCIHPLIKKTIISEEIKII